MYKIYKYQFYLFFFTIFLSCRGSDQAQISVMNHAIDDTMTFTNKVKPIFDNRCVVCHSCNDSPCELNLTSWAGIDRGASKHDTYANRITDEKPRRLHIDAKDTATWRKDFEYWSVFNNNNPQSGIMHRFLALKKEEPDFKFKFDGNSRSCPHDKPNLVGFLETEVDSFVESHPWAGMPWGFTELSEQEYATLTKWIENGAPAPRPQADDSHQFPEVHKWEEFLNRQTFKSILSSRYIYEHLFLAHIYFGNDTQNFFRLVRSKTPPGSAVDEIATRRPYDFPGKTFYYRFVRISETIVAKNHIIFPLNDQKMQRYSELFLNSTWNVIKRAPDFNRYEIDVASNPFNAFSEIPAKSRYQFMLDEAEYFIKSFIRGPVCRGQLAVNVINDKFWVTFMDPKFDPSVNDIEFLHKNKVLLQIPSIDASFWNSAKNLINDRDFISNYNHFGKVYRDKLAETYGEKRLPLHAIWNGDGHNANAFLTVFRHFDNATVIKGLHGDLPKTAWMINYPIFETIYYNLVAGFDVYSSIGKQIITRLYMETSRMASEDLFLNLLPDDKMHAARNYWSREKDGIKSMIVKARDAMFDFYTVPDTSKHSKKPINLSENRALMRETFINILANMQTQVINQGFDDLNCTSCPTIKRAALGGLDDFESKLRKTKIKGQFLRYFPEVSFVRLTKNGSTAGWYTIIKNTAHYNVSNIIFEDDFIEDHEITLEFFRGFIGTYPNALFSLEVEDADEFLKELQTATEADNEYLLPDDARTQEISEALEGDFVIDRYHDDFWNIIDDAHQSYRDPHKGGLDVGAGIFDLNRYMNIYD